MKCQRLPKDARLWWTLWFREDNCWYFLLCGTLERMEEQLVQMAVPDHEYLILPPGECPIAHYSKCHREDHP